MLAEGLWGTGGTNTPRELLRPLTQGGSFQEVTGGEEQRQYAPEETEPKHNTLTPPPHTHTQLSLFVFTEQAFKLGCKKYLWFI